MPIPFLRDIEFAQPAWLLLLLAIPLLFLLRGAFGRAPAVMFGALPLLKDSAKKVRSRYGLPTAAIATLLAFTAAVIALARPQKVNSKDKFTASGVEIYLAIDVSFSMSILDFRLDGRKINRLRAAKHVISRFVDARPSDRIGLVIFSGRPHALGPLTLDHAWLNETISKEIHFDHPIESGTAIGTAISACASRLSEREADTKAKSQVIVMLTDGGQNVPGLKPDEAARLAKTLGIRVYPIAIGTHGQHYVPKVRRVMDQSFDFGTLKEIARITGTKAYMANDTKTLQRIFDEIDDLEKTEIAQRTTVETNELYQWFVGAAFCFFTIGLALEHSRLNFAP